MAEKNVAVFISSDETDSADEGFVFTRKRKADSFFIDLTDDDCKRKKANCENESKKKPTCSDDVSTSGTEDKGSGAKAEIVVLKVIPGDDLGPKSFSAKQTKQVKEETASISDECEMLKVSLPKLMSPPRVVQVVGAPYMSGDVIDLTKPPAIEQHKQCTQRAEVAEFCKEKSCNNNDGNSASSQDSAESTSMEDSTFHVRDEDVSPNQLGDPKARELFDRVLYLGELMNISVHMTDLFCVYSSCSTCYLIRLCLQLKNKFENN